jgi:hypothetical protein
MCQATHEAARSARDVSASVTGQVRDAEDVAGSSADKGQPDRFHGPPPGEDLGGEFEAMARRNLLGALADAVAIGFLIGVWRRLS